MNKTQIIRNVKHMNDNDKKENTIKNSKNSKNSKNNKNNKNNKNIDNDSSDISSYNEDNENNENNEDYENMSLDEASQHGKEKFFKTELMEKIVKYIKIDDTIKQKQKELQLQVKALKTQKTDMEKYIITYLEAIKEDFVNIEGTGKLIKTTSTTKGAIKIDNIKTSVVNGIRKQNINIDERKLSDLLESVMVSVEQNRPVKTRTYIKRTKGKNGKTQKNNNNNNNNNNDGVGSDDDIPKYN
jgi:hypothetical protein